MGKLLRSGGRVFCLLMTVFLFVFQIMLCLYAFDCTGISIVWSALCGFNMMLYAMLSTTIQRDGSAILKYGIRAFMVLFCCYCLALWIYYGVVEELLTTLAHFCALLLGFVIGVWFKYTYSELYSQEELETQSLIIGLHY